MTMMKNTENMTLKRFTSSALLLSALLLHGGCHDPGPGAGGGRKITSTVNDWRDEVIYQVLIDRFADGDYSNNYQMDRTALARYQGGDYQGIIDKIAYFKELGVTTLWISPAVKNLEQDAGFAGYHGYWTQDFKGVNPHFGDLAKLQELVDTLHDNGFKVILDIVTNHIGQLFYYDANLNGQPDDTLYGGGGQSDGSGNKDLPGRLTRMSEWDPDYDSRGIQAFTSLGESGHAPIEWVYMPALNRVPVQPPEFQNKSWYHRRGRVTAWEHFKAGTKAEVDKYCNKLVVPDNNIELCPYVRAQETFGDFPGGLKDLATDNPAVRDALIGVFKWWISVGDFDGYRIDTLKHVDYAFWNAFAPAMRAHAKALGKEKFLMFGEAFSGVDRLLGSYTGKYDKELMEGTQYPNLVDSVFYFSQKYSLDYVFKSGGPTTALESLHKDRLKYYRTTPHTGGITAAPHEALINFIDNHDVSRFLYGKGGDKGLKDRLRALHAVLAYLFTTVGIPNIYYGTEQNFAGGNDPNNREVMWRGNPNRAAGNLPAYDTSNPTFTLIKTLTGLRKQYAPLRRGDFTIRWTTDHVGTEADAGIFAYERVYNKERALVVINTKACASDATGKVTTVTFSSTTNAGANMKVGFADGTKLKNVYPDTDKNDTFTVASGAVNVKVPCQGFKILVKD